jgi:iron complex transport system ATP-binding protein
MNPASLSLANLYLHIAGRTLCQPFSLELHAGQRWAVLGVNGAGKSTLLHCLAGLREPTAGQVSLNQRRLADWSRHALSQQLAMLLQQTDAPLSGTVLDYVLLGRHPHLRAFAWETAADIQIAQHSLRSVDLADYAQRDITTLSGGERQRLAIALVLAQQTAVLLLDEPVNHLDIRHQQQLLAHLSTLATQQQKLLVMALHDVNLARRYCDHALLLFADGTTAAGKIEVMLDSAMLSRLYAYPVTLVETAAGGVIVPL